MSADSGPFIYDASAVLAMLLDEDGAEAVETRLLEMAGIMSVVNYCEVLTKLGEVGLEQSEFDSAFARVPLTIVDVNRDMARFAAALRPATRSAGLSMGDRFCIACAFYYRGTAVTADRCWRDIKAGVPILCIR